MNTDSDNLEARFQEPAIFQNGNIILRGEKNAPAPEGGTEIVMINEFKSKTPDKMWTSPYLFDFRGPQEKSETLGKVSQDAKQGDFEISVSKTEKLEVGDWIVLYLKEPSEKLLKDIFKEKNVEDSWTVIRDRIITTERHKIVAIDREKKIVTLKEPLKSDINSKHRWSVKEYKNSSEVGVEKIYFKGRVDEYLAKDNDGKFKHHKNITHDGGWSILKFNNLTDSWIRDCSFENVSRSVSIESSAAVIVKDIVIKGSQGHNAVSVSNSMGVLVTNVVDTSSAQPRHNLFDEGLILWNYKQTNSPDKPFTFWAKGDKHQKVLNPRIIGLHGTPVEPVSLYEYQLKKRRK